MNDNLVNYILHLADDTLILSHRNSEWCGHGPVLEQDIAITNISLDLLGQARNFYQYAAVIIGDGAIEDSLAYLRDTREYKNCLLAEQPNGDWAVTVLRQFFFSSYQYFLYRQLQTAGDTQIAAIAEKALKEITYHLRWSSEWVIRLGDGTAESHYRMLKAVETLWPFTGEFFTPVSYESALINCGLLPDISLLRKEWMGKIRSVFDEATIAVPPENVWMQTGGKEGMHTEQLGYILADMQFMQRAYPGLEW